MTKIITWGFVLLFLVAGVQAQPWMPTGRPQRLADVVRQYEAAQAQQANARQATPAKPEEDEDYHFQRWLWYWKEHLDREGFMVPPAANLAAARQAQQDALAKTTLSNLANWTFMGPTTSPGGYHGIGRINVIAFHPTDTNTFIIGSAGGGAWRTTTGGLSWTPLYNNLPVLGVSDVDYNPLNPNTLFLCTGDRDAGDTHSVGVLKSADGGLTWNTTGIQFGALDFALTNALVINRYDTNSLVVATSEGLFKSYDGGQTFAMTQAGNFKSVLYHPQDSNILYAGRVADAQIFRSADGGATWSQMTAFTNGGRVEMAVCPAAPNIVMAVLSDGQTNGLEGVYSSADEGLSFFKIFSPVDCSQNILSGALSPTPSDCGGQAWYDLCIAIHPADPTQVLVGGVNTWYSTDGGGSFNIANQWYSGLPGVATVHADKHYFAYHPLVPGLLYECNDGGLYQSAQPNTFLWDDLSNGLAITQFYRVATSDVATYVVGGSQDNGTKRINFSGTFDELTGGDGMDCQMDFSDSNTIYTSSQYGWFNRSQDGGQTFQGISPPSASEGSWITPIIIHPWDAATLVVGYSEVWASQDQGNTWNDISTASFTTASKMRRLSMSLSDDKMIYGLWGDNSLRRTPDFGNSWSAIGQGFGSVYFTDILADPKDKNTLWVTFAGYDTNKVARYKPGSGLFGWTTYNAGLPAVPIRCITIDSANNTQYVGTDIGVWFRDTSMTLWAPYNTGLPTVEVTDLSINYATGEIVAATYGRGMWKSPRQRDTATLSVLDFFGPLQPGVITAAPNPTRGAFSLTANHEALRGQSVTVLVRSMDGQTVYRQTGRFDATGILQIDLAHTTPKGVYVVSVLKEGLMVGHTQITVLGI